MSVLAHLTALREGQGHQLAWLIDPDEPPTAHHWDRLPEFQAAGLGLVLVGGSHIHRAPTPDWIAELRERTECPVVLFPGSGWQLCAGADALLFLTLISGRNPELLIGQQVAAAPFVEQLQTEVLPTGYLLIDGGRPTSASYLSQTLPLPADKPQLARYTALAGQYLGLRVLYLDAGSGAERSVPPDLVAAVGEGTRLPLIVGGGIRRWSEAQTLFDAGAQVVVVGTAFERGWGLN
mgnify:CR=1 FL=1